MMEELCDAIKISIILGLLVINGAAVGGGGGGKNEENFVKYRNRRQNPENGLCKPGFYYSNGWCYPTPNRYPVCPEGYQLRDNLCYPKELKPCPFDSTTTSTTTTTTTEWPTSSATVPTTTSTSTSTTTVLPSTTTTTTTTPPPTTTTTTTITPSSSTSATTETLPISTTTTTSFTTTSSPPPLCPEGCVLRGNECCDCASPSPSLTTTTTTTPITPTGYPPSASIRCPYGSVLFKGKCRKILCPYGEYVNGLCIQVTCPAGTLWSGHSCQTPGYATTILEIENVFINEAHNHAGKIVRINNNNNNNNTSYATELTTVVVPPDVSTLQPPPLDIIASGCCTIFTPRICKKYGKKWICFNRRLKRCDRNICKYPTVYLKTPKVTYEPPILIMPPNPPLKACPTPNCDAKDMVDCSGCPEGRRERCSPYCYKYICPEGTCGYIDHEPFCKSYPGVVGCRKEDGCIWGWCSAAGDK